MYLASTKEWYLERVLFLIAGSVSLIGLVLGFYISHWWFVINLLIGLNLTLFAFTGFCPMAVILSAFGFSSKNTRG
ncbi:YgaP family membrane protein [Leptospira ilyithenensis]|uniref:DUF2892 domain-containing protein n=1 Tax=Leptospira ilyithenensis TaxID=2484901 RepID=A0A4R9LTM3_9LEPT|nr:DUF2892 domain-containing protein [Leptospira ilyithenensis]TGN10513.1 DUF2892 domain-containing protein [Leptospira ilyithenensis]